jgi:hypothetical protein
VVVWAVAAAVAYQLEADAELVKAASQAALIPVWFLAVYILVTLVVPVSFAIWEKTGLWSVVALAALAILVDLVGVGLGQGWLRWANYAPIWLAVHQLGYWWWRGDPGLRGIVALGAIGAVWLWLLLNPAGYPVSMVSVPGEAFSNTRPPTTAMLAIGALQISLLLMLAKPVDTWLRRETPWAVVILVASNIMSIYLWHLTVLIVLAGLSFGLGGVLLGVEPGTGLWWLLRPLWVTLLIAGLLPFLAVFGRFESRARAPGQQGAGPVQTGIGAVMSCAGLTVLALEGVSLDRLPGFNWMACLLILAGIGLATRPLARPSRRS